MVQEQIHKIFEEREHKIFEEVSQLAKDVARKEVALLEFEMFYEAMVPQAGKEKAEQFVKKLREKKWQKALKKAGGDEEKAIFFYDAA